jgi:hypothetical protein
MQKKKEFTFLKMFMNEVVVGYTGIKYNNELY